MTDLDKFEQAIMNWINTGNHKYYEQKEHLKSQLESKLAESEILRVLLAYFDKETALDLQAEIIRLLQIQSQHTNLVKAIQDNLPKFTTIMVRNAIDGCYDHIENLEEYFKSKDKELQNLLESTKESK